MTTIAEELGVYRAAFERFRAGRPAEEPAWLRALREEGMARFHRLGFPTTKDEEWKYTSVAPIARTSFRRAEGGAGGVTADDIATAVFGYDPTIEGTRARGQDARPGDGLATIVFVNGRHAPGLSSRHVPAGLEVLALREALARRPEALEAHLARYAADSKNPFTALNAAFLEDGAFVSVLPGAVVRQPIHLIFFSTRGDGPEPTVSHPRNLVLAGRGSQATVVESYGGAEGEVYFTNAVTEIVLEDGAILDHYKVQRESEAAFHVATLAVRQGRDSRFSDHSTSLGAALARNDIDQVFAAEGGECVLNGLFMAWGTQHTDTHTLIDHARPHCSSRERYKGILDGRARGVFHGTILVQKDAQKTDAHQTNQNLLLSREALVNSTPALKILADDVKCKHGSTTGQLDPAALFYLRSRGIGEEAARSLLTWAFASDLVGRIRVEPVRAGLERHLQSRLPSAPEIQEAAV